MHCCYEHSIKPPTCMKPLEKTAFNLSYCKDSIKWNGWVNLFKTISDKPAAPSETCTCWPPLGRWDGPCPTRPGRRPAASAPAQPGPSGAALALCVMHPPEQHAALPSPSPDAQKNGRSRLPVKTDSSCFIWEKTATGDLHCDADFTVNSLCIL